MKGGKLPPWEFLKRGNLKRILVGGGGGGRREPRQVSKGRRGVDYRKKKGGKSCAQGGRGEERKRHANMREKGGREGEAWIAERNSTYAFSIITSLDREKRGKKVSTIQ